MAYPGYRPLPSPPATGASYFGYGRGSRLPPGSPGDPYSGRYGNPYHNGPGQESYNYQQSALTGGTLIHKGFYDLLSYIPTPSPSRFLQGWSAQPEVVAGPRYEEIGRGRTAASPPPAQGLPSSPPRASPLYTTPASPPQRTGRRISKDMVSRPTNFVYVVLMSVKGYFLIHIQAPSACFRRRPVRGLTLTMGP
jgi:protein-serine/threonine kinase